MRNFYLLQEFQFSYVQFCNFILYLNFQQKHLHWQVHCHKPSFQPRSLTRSCQDLKDLLLNREAQLQTPNIHAKFQYFCFRHLLTSVQETAVCSFKCFNLTCPAEKTCVSVQAEPPVSEPPAFNNLTVKSYNFKSVRIFW